MKDGWIVVLVLLIIAFVVSSWFLINRVGERSVTGNLADNDGELRNEIVNKNSENNTDNEEILSFDFRCEVESPFFCRIWSFDREKDEIRVRIENIGNKNIIIQSFDVSNCDYFGKRDFFLESGQAKVYDFRCALDKEGTFIGRFDLRFKPEKGGPQQSSAGIIDEELIN